jgi:hypothetical protein
VATTPKVGIVGMRALRRDIARQTGQGNSAVYKAIRQAGLEAAEPVAGLTRSKLPQVTGRLAGDVRTTASRTGAAVRMGRSNLRYAGWAEFGGHRRVPHDSQREFLRQGRYLFPSSLQLASTSARLYSAALGRVLNNSSLWTNTTTNPAEVHD